MDKVDQLASLLRCMQCVDLAPRLERGMPKFPTHPHMVIDPTMTHQHDGYYCQSIAMAEHTGCHVDAPSHIHANMMDATVDRLPPNQLIGPAVLYDFSARDWKPGDLLKADDVLAYEREHEIAVRQDDMALVCFGWHKRYWRTDSGAHFYARNQPGMDADVAELFAERRVRAVGADTIACEIATVEGKLGPQPGHDTYWLPNGILIVEAMARLETIARKSFIVAAPLPIENGSGSPLRPLAYF